MPMVMGNQVAPSPVKRLAASMTIKENNQD